MAIRSCTCGKPGRDSAGLTLIISPDGHYRDCASLLPDPEACNHSSHVQHNGWSFCGACGMGMRRGGPAWVRPHLAPGFAEAIAEQREREKKEREDAEAREETYALDGIRLDYGLTGLDRSDLYTLAECCMRELAART